MAIAYVQRANAAQAATFSSGNNHTLTFGTALTLNSLRVAPIRCSGAADILTSVSGSVSGAYALAGSIVNGASSTRTYLWYKEGGAAGSEIVTAQTSTTGNTLRWDALEYTGVLASAALDGSIVANPYTATTAPATGSKTTSADNALVIAINCPDSSATSIAPGGSETERSEIDIRFQVQDFIKAVAGSTSSSWVNGASVAGTYILAAFLADTGGGLPTPGWPQYTQRRTTLITL